MRDESRLWCHSLGENPKPMKARQNGERRVRLFILLNQDKSRKIRLIKTALCRRLRLLSDVISTNNIADGQELYRLLALLKTNLHKVARIVQRLQ